MCKQLLFLLCVSLYGRVYASSAGDSTRSYVIRRKGPLQVLQQKIQTATFCAGLNYQRNAVQMSIGFSRPTFTPAHTQDFSIRDGIALNAIILQGKLNSFGAQYALYLRLPAHFGFNASALYAYSSYDYVRLGVRPEISYTAFGKLDVLIGHQFDWLDGGSKQHYFTYGLLYWWH